MNDASNAMTRPKRYTLADMRQMALYLGQFNDNGVLSVETFLSEIFDNSHIYIFNGDITAENIASLKIALDATLN